MATSPIKINKASLTYSCDATNDSLQLYIQKNSSENMILLVVLCLWMVVFRLITLSTDEPNVWMEIISEGLAVILLIVFGIFSKKFP
jgi:hypothetical protein